MFAGNILPFVWVSCYIYSLSAIFFDFFVVVVAMNPCLFPSLSLVVCHHFAFFLSRSLFMFPTHTLCHLKFTQCAAIVWISFSLSLSNTDPTHTHTSFELKKYHGATNECDSIIMWRSMNKTKHSEKYKNYTHTHTQQPPSLLLLPPPPWLQSGTMWAPYALRFAIRYPFAWFTCLELNMHKNNCSLFHVFV